MIRPTEEMICTKYPGSTHNGYTKLEPMLHVWNLTSDLLNSPCRLLQPRSPVSRFPSEGPKTLQTSWECKLGGKVYSWSEEPLQLLPSLLPLYRLA